MSSLSVHQRIYLSSNMPATTALSRTQGYLCTQNTCLLQRSRPCVLRLESDEDGEKNRQWAIKQNNVLGSEFGGLGGILQDGECLGKALEWSWDALHDSTVLPIVGPMDYPLTDFLENPFEVRCVAGECEGYLENGTPRGRREASPPNHLNDKVDSDQ